MDCHRPRRRDGPDNVRRHRALHSRRAQHRGITCAPADRKSFRTAHTGCRHQTEIPAAAQPSRRHSHRHRHSRHNDHRRTGRRIGSRAASDHRSHRDKLGRRTPRLLPHGRTGLLIYIGPDRHCLSRTGIPKARPRDHRREPRRSGRRKRAPDHGRFGHSRKDRHRTPLAPHRQTRQSDPRPHQLLNAHVTSCRFCRNRHRAGRHHSRRNQTCRTLARADPYPSVHTHHRRTVGDSRCRPRSLRQMRSRTHARTGHELAGDHRHPHQGRLVQHERHRHASPCQQAPHPRTVRTHA